MALIPLDAAEQQRVQKEIARLNRIIEALGSDAKDLEEEVKKKYRHIGHLYIEIAKLERVCKEGWSPLKEDNKARV